MERLKQCNPNFDISPFIAGRMLSYNVFHIYSSNAARQLDTIVWAAATGFWIGLMYLFLKPGIPQIYSFKSNIFCSCDLRTGLFPVLFIHASCIRFSNIAGRVLIGICRFVREVFDGYLIRCSGCISVRRN